MLFQKIVTPNHFHFAHLTSLHLEKIDLTNENINILCNSVYAKQLTSLRLNRVRGVAFETYQQIFGSFNQLQSFQLDLNRRIIVNQANDEMQQKEYY